MPVWSVAALQCGMGMNLRAELAMVINGGVREAGGGLCVCVRRGGGGGMPCEQLFAGVGWHMLTGHTCLTLAAFRC